MSKYSIGLDFGTLSARAVLVDIETGEEVAVSVYGYQDGVIDTKLPNSDVMLPSDYALQNPMDYVDAMEGLLSDIWKKVDIDPKGIIGIGVDFTACSMIALDKDFQPLCFQERYRNCPHAWVKLWKHHGAQSEADIINSTARMMDREFISRYGGKSSSEWLFAKILETRKSAPEIYDAAEYFMEAADWIIYLLTGSISRSAGMAGFKAFWDKKGGYPDKAFCAALDPAMENVAEDKLKGEVKQLYSRAGGLTREMAEKTGLLEGISVAVANIDAHVSFPAAGLKGDGSMLMIMGTSLCHILINKKYFPIKGISGVVQDGVLPGYYGYESGQAAVGDILDWFVSYMIPSEYANEVITKDINIFDMIEEKVSAIKPGKSGVLALDWWNGNRSLLVDSSLSGMIIGLTLTTTPEEIYRALIEATAFGTRKIVEEYERCGISINDIYACGGLSYKSPAVMQIYADVLQREIHVSSIQQTSAFGAAMSGAVAAGKENGGYDDIYEAIEKMTKPSVKSYKPDSKNAVIYTRLFEEYSKLHDYFGCGKNDVMKTLKFLKEA